MKTPTLTRSLAAGALALAASIGLTACAMTPAPAEDSGANRADVMFVQMMIPHHEQAIEMSDMLLAKSDIEAETLAMAEEIKAAQGPEIEQMESWLDDWGMSSMGGMDGMDHGGSGGMMSEGDMDDLEAATGQEAGDLFLTQMIEHHEGAIEMADDVIDDGRHPDVRALGESIVASQAEEIERMRAMIES